MIPSLIRKQPLNGLTLELSQHLALAGFQGDVEVGDSSRTVYSTDNSIYQVEPTGIVFPKGTDDLKILASVLEQPAFRDVVISPRGGGTGTNGQSLTSGIVVDCSRHMNRILEIDTERRVARVQSGVVKDQLNKALKPHGLFFAPELSTSNRATIGGMVSTDACGQGSCLYGKTSNHILGLNVVLTNGEELWSRPLDGPALAQAQQKPGRIGEIYRAVARIATEKRALIDEIFPNLNRYMTGYDLKHLWREDGRFDLNAILCGSEGTLAMIAEVEVNLLPIPAHALLVNIRYDSFNTALEHARALVALKVASVETIDEKVLGLAKKDIVWPGIARFFPDDGGSPTNGINIVELVADSAVELESKFREVIAALDADQSDGAKPYTIARDPKDIEAIWTMRKRSVGLLGNVDGPVRPVPFVEDTAVPPENLAAYIREFRALLDGEGLSYGMFGHVDAGVLHVRPALDLTRTDHEPLVRKISDGVVALTRKYGGVLWGEHGKGVRSEYVPEFFGALYPSLQEIKGLFDPRNRLNPGKIAAPASQALLKIDEVPLRGQFDRIIGLEIREAFDNAAYCNGNGACFDFDDASLMCPSYKATRDRRYSPKGRASLMREWLRLMAESGKDPRKEAGKARSASAIRTLPARLWNSINPANRNDFSHEVREAMDSCLACKACAGQCPVKVSVPAFRAKFLEIYYGRYARPIKDMMVASIENTLPLFARLKPAYNAWVGSSLGQALMRRAGLTALPEMPALSLAREARRMGVAVATPERMRKLTEAQRQQAVVFVLDAFTAHFDPAVGLAALQLARKMGFTPYLAAPNQNGKALHVHGYLGAFEKTASKSIRYLNELAEMGIALVGLDPSMTLTYRSEYKGVEAARIKAQVNLVQEWLHAHRDRLRGADTMAREKRLRLLGHCTERSNVPSSMKQWKSVFQQIGVELDVPETGCCGMAGTFGHEVRNRPISEKLYAASWNGILASSGEGDIVMATGYSCRSQVKAIDSRAIRHPVQILNEMVMPVGA